MQEQIAIYNDTRDFSYRRFVFENESKMVWDNRGMWDNRIPQYYHLHAYPKGSLSTRRQCDICYICGVGTSSRGRCPMVK